MSTTTGNTTSGSPSKASTYGEDLSITVEAYDCDVTQAAALLGAACNEMMRTNLGLAMQEQG